MSIVFEDPAKPTGINYQELKGSLLIVAVRGFEEHVPTQFTEPGEQTPAIRADVTVVDGPQAGTAYNDTLIFPRGLLAQLKPRVGGMVLGRLGQGQAQPGKNAPWLLLEATPEDRQKAERALAQPAGQGSEPPF